MKEILGRLFDCIFVAFALFIIYPIVLLLLLCEGIYETIKFKLTNKLNHYGKRKHQD